MEWFTSVEFYIIAVTIAILMIGMIFSSSPRGEAVTYIYTGEKRLSATGCDEKSMMNFTSDENDEATICHQNVVLPEDCELNMVVEIIGDKLTCVEKLADSQSRGELCRYDVTWRLKCLKALKYHVRCECGYNDTWCTLAFLNRDGYKTQSEMKY